MDCIQFHFCISTHHHLGMISKSVDNITINSTLLKLIFKRFGTLVYLTCFEMSRCDLIINHTLTMKYNLKNSLNIVLND